MMLINTKEEQTLRAVFPDSMYSEVAVTGLTSWIYFCQGLRDVLNYGFYDPPYNGRSGKFLEEERPFKDYPLRGPYVEVRDKSFTSSGNMCPVRCT